MKDEVRDPFRCLTCTYLSLGSNRWVVDTLTRRSLTCVSDRSQSKFPRLLFVVSITYMSLSTDYRWIFILKDTFLPPDYTLDLFSFNPTPFCSFSLPHLGRDLGECLKNVSQNNGHRDQRKPRQYFRGNS